MYNLGQIIGFIAMSFSVLSNLQHRRNRILIFKFCSDVLWVMSFYLIGSYPACFTTSIAIGREIVFYNKDKKWANNKIWIYIFATAFLISAIISSNNIFGILPAISSILSTVAFYCTNVKKMKLLLLVQTSGMLVYNLIYHSMAGICDGLLGISTIIIYFIYAKNKKYNSN